LIAGVSPLELEEWTQGEVNAVIEAVRERRRREHKNRAVIAYNQAMVIGSLFAEGVTAPEIYDAFPFWTEAEIKQMQLEKYKALMQRWSSARKDARSDVG
jgi:hypothetical protein